MAQSKGDSELGGSSATNREISSERTTDIEVSREASSEASTMRPDVATDAKSREGDSAPANEVEEGVGMLRGLTLEARRGTCKGCEEEGELAGIKDLACGHQWCEECLLDWFKHAMKDISRPRPSCCDNHVIERDVATTTDALAEIMAQYEEKKARYEYDIDRPLYCHVQRCSAAIPVATINFQGAKGTCPDCGAVTCYLCKQAEHDGRDCAEESEFDATMELAMRMGYQHCYDCDRVIERAGGCRHMECPCGAKFCYLCGGELDSCRCGADPRTLGERTMDDLVNGLLRL
ncbi:IBR finger domain-containing protein [Phlyctema vagabunda]|uniref:RBR-type E3 ubiquitin transferase n=1 Tax=Phlyctema vagabunda TaxID=108571 RepID=A0ABR4PSU2_9HELO